MSDNEKIARVKILLGDSTISDETIAVYLDLAKTEILNRLYQLYEEIPTEMPTRYDNKQCSLAVVMYNSNASGGFGGISSHNESAMGTSVTDYFIGGNVYGMSQWANYLADITPFARTYGGK